MMRGIGDGYTAGCGYWNGGDGNVPDEETGMIVRIEPLPPGEAFKEVGLDPRRNIFGSKGERLAPRGGSDSNLRERSTTTYRKQESILIDDDDDDEIEEVFQSSQIEIDEDDDITIVGDNMCGFTSSSAKVDPKVKRPEDSDIIKPNPIHITRLPSLEKEQLLFDSSFFRNQPPPPPLGVEDIIEKNRQKHLKVVRRKFNSAALTGEILPFSLQQ